MISSLEIEGFRGIETGALKKLPMIAVLLGPNGSCKSTFLEAAFLATRTDASLGLDLLRRRRGPVADDPRWLFHDGRMEKACRVSVGWEADGKTLDNTVEIKPTGSGIMAERQGRAEDPPEARFVDHGAGAERDPLHRVYSEARLRGGTEWAKDLVREVDPTIHNFEILTSNDQPVLFVHYADRSVPVSLAGDGMASLIRICLEMSARTHGTVLIGKPEAHQHTASVARTARAVVMAARRGCQVIMSTHSMELLDGMLADLQDAEIDLLAVYRVRMPDGKTRVLRMEGSLVAAARAEIADDLR